VTPHSTFVRPLSLLGSCSNREGFRKELSDVEMIGTERTETELAVILGVDTHLDSHVGVAVDHLGREAWARPACLRPRRVTRGSCAGRRVSVA
jgi:predicted nucleotidyltransferase